MGLRLDGVSGDYSEGEDMNKHLIVLGILQNVTGRLPGPTITAPLRERGILTMNSEAFRLAQFELSENVHQRKTNPVKRRYTVTT